MPKVLSDVGYSASEIGIIFAAAPLIRFILPFFFMRGWQLNATIFKAALLLVIFASLSFYFSLYSFYPLLFSNIALGVALSLILPYVEVIALESIGKERYGKSRLFGSLGFILVALVLVKVLSEAFVALHFLVGMVAVMSLSAFFVQKKAHTEEHLTQMSSGNDVALFKDYKLWMGLLLMQMSFGSFYNFFTIYETDHGLSMDTTIYLWSFGVFVEVLMLYMQAPFLQKNLLHVIEFTIAATVLRWFLLFLYPTELLVLYFAQALHALSFALFHSAAISYLYGHYKNRSLTQQLFSGITYGLGGLSGALLSGYIYEYMPKYLFASSTLIASVSLVMVWMYERELRRDSQV
jgi:PPP family 3-phenylpropionic acid transporter